MICWFTQCIFDYIVNCSELLQNHPSEWGFPWQENISLIVTQGLLGIYYKIESIVEIDWENKANDKC